MEIFRFREAKPLIAFTSVPKAKSFLNSKKGKGLHKMLETLVTFWSMLTRLHHVIPAEITFFPPFLLVDVNINRSRWPVSVYMAVHNAVRIRGS